MYRCCGAFEVCVPSHCLMCSKCTKPGDHSLKAWQIASSRKVQTFSQVFTIIWLAPRYKLRHHLQNHFIFVQFWIICLKLSKLKLDNLILRRVGLFHFLFDGIISWWKKFVLCMPAILFMTGCEPMKQWILTQLKQ